MSQTLNSLISNVAGFFSWWLFLMPSWLFRKTESWLATMDDGLQVLSNLRLWLSFEPLFGDYGWRGRLIGFFIRGLRFIYSLFVMLLILLFGFALILAWLILPVLSIWLIIYYG